MISPPERFASGEDIYILLDVEDVAFRWDGAKQNFVRKFRGENTESKVPHSNRLLIDAVMTGIEFSADEYRRF